MGKYDKITQEDFDNILKELVEGTSADELLQIPGVYEALSEHFNNDVLSQWEDENVTDDEEVEVSE